MLAELTPPPGRVFNAPSLTGAFLVRGDWSRSKDDGGLFPPVVKMILRYEFDFLPLYFYSRYSYSREGMLLNAEAVS